MNIDSITSLTPEFPVSQLNFCLEIKANMKVIAYLSLHDFTSRHYSSSSCLRGNKTEIIISSYEDHFLVIATQIGTMGTILHARKEEGMSTNPTFNVSVIFGKRDEPMLVACARQLVEHMSLSGFSKPLVLSLGLKDHSAETLKGIVSAVVDKKLW